MIDIHVIEKPGWPVGHVLAQLRHPLVTTHVVPHIEGNLLAARRAGYSRGTHPLVTWVDPDDEVLELSWLEEAVGWMQDPATSMVFPRWQTPKHTAPVMHPPLTDLNRGSYPHAHHLTLMRRPGVHWALSRLEAFGIPMVQRVEPMVVRLQQTLGRARQHPAVAYFWRTGNGASQVPMTQVEAEAIGSLYDLGRS